MEDIIAACELLARKDDLQVCIDESLKGGLIAGLGAFVGGVLLGPPGIAVGAAVGGVAGAVGAKEYKPLCQIITEMTEHEQKSLADHMRKIISKLSITDAAILMAIINNPKSMERDVLLKELGVYFKQKLVSG